MAVPAVPARADTVPDLPDRLGGRNGDYVAHYLMSRDARETGRQNLVLDNLVTVLAQSG